MYFFQDFKAHNMSFYKVIYKVFLDRGMSAVFLYRLSRWFYLKKIIPIAVIIKHLNIFFNHCEISYQSDIGPGFRVAHALGTVITLRSAGRNFSVFQNVTIGNNGAKEINGVKIPVFGDNVKIYAGAVIGGPIEVGNGVIIGANTTVFTNIPDHHKVINGFSIIKEKKNNLVSK